MDSEEGSTNNLFDPARDVLDKIKSGVAAGLDTTSKKNIGKGVEKKGNALNGLKSAENGAVGTGMNRVGDNLNDVRKNESNGGGFYSGSGKPNKASDGGNNRKGKGFLKKGGPIAGIVGLILGVMALVGGSQVFQPFSLLAQFQETFNSMHVSTSQRSNVLVRYQMDHGLVKDPVKSKIFGEDTFKITKKQASELSMRGIEYDDDFDGNGTRVLKYDDGSGEIKIVAADEDAASRLTKMDLSKFDTDDIKYNTEAVSFKNYYEADADFFKSYNDGSMTWRGAIANWFGSTTMKFLSNNKLTRNMFENFDQKVKESGESPRKVATDTISKNAGEVEEGGIKVATAGEDEDEDGGRVRGDNEYEGGKMPKMESEAEVKEKLNKIGDTFSKVSGTAQAVVNTGCAALNFIGAVSLLVTASEALQIINLTTGYFEAIDKVKYGDGNDSPLNTLMDALNEKKENTNSELAFKSGVSIDTSEDGMKNNVTENGINALETKQTTTTKSAMDAEGIKALYGGYNVNPDDPSVQSFNFTGSIKRILGGIGTSMAAFETCAFAKLAASAVGGIMDGIEIAGCIAGVLGAPFTFGVSLTGCSGIIADIAIGAAISVGIALLISGIVSTITPVIANMLTRDLISNLGGEDLGNALTSGGNMYLGNTHRSNGGSLASEEKYVEYAAAHQKVVAEDAKQERLTRDPFDATSKYTFLGTLLTQMMSFANANSLSSTITSASSVVSSSLLSMSSAALAYNISDTLVPMEEYEETCPYLASIGAVGDAFCNPYSITDVSTMQDDPSDLTNRLDDNFRDELASDGNVQIDGSSDLAKYILFCDNRTSAFGIADQNIVNDVSDWGNVHTENSTFDNTTNAAIGAVPIIGDLIDVVDNAEALANTGYVGGESCVAGNDVSGQSAPGWDKAKQYQRFIEDQSLMEGAGLIEKSAVTAFLEDYYEKNPLDNSYEGILARYSGMDKETVVAILDVVDYGLYIANYNPSERYAFGAPVVEVKEELKFDNENQIANNPLIVLINQTIYADVRNRSFAA